MEVIKCFLIFISLSLMNACDVQDNVNCDVESFIWKDGNSYEYASNINTDRMFIFSKKIGNNEWVISESFVFAGFGEPVRTNSTYRLIKEGCELIQKGGSKSYPYFIIPTNAEKVSWEQYGEVYEGESITETELKCLVSGAVVDSYSTLNSFHVSCAQVINGAEDVVRKYFVRGKGLTRLTHEVNEKGYSKTLWDFSLSKKVLNQ